MAGEIHEAVVVGAGFSGIAAVIELKKLGYRDIVVVEREADVGGTWYVNSYPGAAVDICSTSYQYWFEPNPRWGRFYAEGPELHAYARHVVDKYDVAGHVRFNTAVESAVWDEDDVLWRITLDDGATVNARLLINATGFLSQRHYPDIEGLDTFEGEILHTTWWDRTKDLTGRRVAVIGTGATAVQMLPKVADQAASLTVYQRTPIWVTPKFDFPIPDRMQDLFVRRPLLHRLVSLFTNVFYQVILMTGLINHHRFGPITKIPEWQVRAMLFLQVRNKSTRAKLSPDYTMGCKRPSISNRYYRMFNKKHVHLQTAGIQRIEPDGIVARDGTKTAIDTLVLATGFNVYDHNFPSYETIGRGGVNLGKWWREHRYASYQGLTTPHFPNYLGMTTPFAFTGLSFFDGIRGQITHMNRLLGEMRRRRASTFEVSEAATLQWTDAMRTKMNDSLLFQGQCATANSYYFNDSGDVIWFRPESTRSALKAQNSFPFTDYEIA